MARIRDLGINAIPVTMRPLEIGPGAAFEIPAGQAPAYLACGPSNCQGCACGNTVKEDTSLSCDELTQCVPPPSNREPEAGYHTSGFTLQSVAELKQQLRTRRKELNH